MATRTILVKRWAVVSDRGWLFERLDGPRSWGAAIGQITLFGTEENAAACASVCGEPNARPSLVLVEVELSE